MSDGQSEAMMDGTIRGSMHEPEIRPEGILEEATRITAGERQRDYDHPLPNHRRIANLWNAYLEARKEPDGPIAPVDAAYMMILLKIARDQFTPKRDNVVDVAGYARCVAQIRGYE